MEAIERTTRDARWRLRARLLLPVLILVVSGAVSLSLIDSFLARRQIDSLVSQRGTAVLAGVAQRLEERQRAQALLAQVLAASPSLVQDVQERDTAALTTDLAPLQAGMEAGQIAIIGRDGGDLLRLGAAANNPGEQAIIAAALAGTPRSAAVVDARGLVVLVAAPIRVPREVIGALVLGTTVDSASLREVGDTEDVELALFRDGRLATTTATDPALVDLLRGSTLTLDRVGQFNMVLARTDYWAAARPLGEDGLLVTLVPLHSLVEASRERTLIVLLGSLELVIALVAVGLLLIRDIAGPLESMVAAARDMARGQYIQRVAPSSIRELNDLGGAINYLAQQVQRHIAQLTHQAFHDPLSGLPNRALFMDRLRHALERSDRGPNSVAVLFLDLDNFKVVNDSLGHHAGDELLVAAAKRLSVCLRRNDTLARFGGDEFTLLLEDVKNVHQATLVAKRIQGVLRAPFVVSGRDVFTTASIGIAFSAPGHDEPEILLRDADLAMYRAKTQGKAHYEIFDRAMNAEAMRRLELETDLRNAIESGELLTYYQPLVELATGRLAGMETLVRWRHPGRGMVNPSEFIALAEETGLIVPIGRWVLEEACRQFQTWRARHPAAFPLTLNVNLSGRQFLHPALVEDIAQVLRETGITARSLKLEITESVMMQDAAEAITILHRLKALGLQIAVDDFGTGYSSLAYLKRFPIDTLKIDHAFVDGAVNDPEDAAIVRAIIELAKTLRLSVTAEGVETADQAAHLRDMGCDLGQGYYFARPLPADEMRALLAAGQVMPVG